jgi:hypothetical protein
MATATETRTEAKGKGWTLPCPHCGQVPEDGEGGLFVELASLDVKCPNCEEHVTKVDLRRLIADAQRLLAWLDAAAT